MFIVIHSNKRAYCYCYGSVALEAKTNPLSFYQRFSLFFGCFKLLSEQNISELITQ